MSVTKWLNNLLLIETFLGIHRNYCNQRKGMKFFLTSKLFIQIALYAFVLAFKIYYFLWISVLNQVNVIYSIFSTTAFINSTTSAVVGICYSRAFQSYYRSISRLSDWFKDDFKLIKSLKKIYWFTVIFTIFFIFFVAYRSCEILKKFSQINKFLIVIIFAVQTLIRLTTVNQQIMLFFVIMIIVCMFKSLNSVVSAVQERVGRRDISSNDQCDITREQVQQWVNLYRDLANCCDKVTICFGREYFFSIALSMPNYILMIYQICYQIGVNKGLSGLDLKKVVMAIFTYALSMLLPLVAGQWARNQARKFHRLLARLYNTIIVIDSKEAEVKSMKDFIRLIKKKPLEIKLLSDIPAGMYVLPVILTLVVNYVIVLLQFNHVI